MSSLRILQVQPIWCMLIAIGGFAQYASAQASLLEEFWARHPPVMAEVEEAYSHVRMVTKETTVKSDAGHGFISKNEYLRKGDLVRGVIEVLQSDNVKFPSGTVKAFGGSAETYFEASKRGVGSDFVIESLRSTANFNQIVRHNARPVFAPYCVFEFRIVDYFKRPEVQILSATTKVLDGQKAISILTEWTEPGSPPESVGYEFYFQPDTWIYIGFTQFEPDDRSARVTQFRLEYEPGSTPPKLTSLEVWGEAPSDPDEDRSASGGTLYEVQSLEFGGIPEEAFTLASLGIEDPVIADGSGSSNPWFIIISVVVFGAAGVIFAVLGVRKRKRANVSQAAGTSSLHGEAS